MFTTIPVKTYHLKPIAREALEATEWLNNLDKLNYGDTVCDKAEELLLELLDLSKGEKRFQNQHSQAHTLEGIQKMFGILKSNSMITAAPRDERERKQFYEKLAKGYKLIGDTIKEEFDRGKLDPKDLYSCLEIIGSGGFACAGRWRQVLEEISLGFSDRINHKDVAKEVESDKLKTKIKELFFQSRVIEGNRAAKEFVEYHYPKIGEETKLHYNTFFKRVVNVLLDFKLPTTMEQDEFLGKSQHSIGDVAENYLEMVNLNDAVVNRLVSLFKERIKEDRDLFDQVVNYAGGIYHNSDRKNQYEDVSEFLCEKVFHGYTNEIREDAVIQMLLDKNFVEIGEKKIDVEKIIRRGLEYNELKPLEDFLKRLPEKTFQNENLRLLLNLRSNRFETLLLKASSRNRISFSRFLIQKGANVEMKDGFGNTALMVSVEKGYLEIAKLLIEKGANLNVQNNYGKTILIASAYNGHIDLTKLLIEKGAYIEGKTNHGNTALMACIANENMELTQYLIENGAKLEAEDRKGNTAIIYAASNGNAEIVKLLIEKGAEITGSVGRKALRYAKEYEHDDIVEIIKKAQKERIKENMLKGESAKGRSLFSYFRGLGS
jgi:ankyrin repeat protein